MNPPLILISPSTQKRGVEFADAFDYARFLLGTHEAAVDAAAHAIKQFDPILKQRVLVLLPFVVAFAARVKNPASAHMMGIDLQRLTVVVCAFPTDFCFGHWSISQVMPSIGGLPSKY